MELIIFIKACIYNGVKTTCTLCDIISEEAGGRYYDEEKDKCLPCNIPYSEYCSMVNIIFFYKY